MQIHAMFGAMRHSTPPAAAPPAAAAIPIEVWEPGAEGQQDRLLFRTGETDTADAIAKDAAGTARRVLEYVEREFGRSGIDGAGGALKLRVHAPDYPSNVLPGNNAYWFDDEQRIWLGDGDGEHFSPLGAAPDVVAHEFFHGVIDAEAGLSYVGQQGALHESFADVLATGIDGNWQIGESVYTPGVAGDAVRDLANLTFRDLPSLPDTDEVHRMSEVPSHAAYLVGAAIGAAELRRVWYTALTDHLKADAGFAGARDATIAAARVLHGASSSQAQAVVDAWAAVGIDADTPFS